MRRLDGVTLLAVAGLAAGCAADRVTGADIAPPLFSHASGLADLTVTSNAFTGPRHAREALFTPSIATLPGAQLAGEVAHVGRGCIEPDDPYLADPAGKIAVIERGVCFFVHKIARAQAAGAIGVIIYNSEAGGEDIILMGAPESLTLPDGTPITFTIPSVFVQRSTGLLLGDGTPPVTAVIAIDAEGKIASAAGQVDGLEESGVLNRGQASALRGALDRAAASAAAGDAAGAARILRAFIRQVEAYVRAGILTVEEGAVLIAAAEAALAAL
ncbi:MAG TPA: PA domain-containing protein [Gemmatimonadales bacterium]|jgi:ribosomal protein S20|nr:PA domain-containing protein [Gemmatimonadales bacterium]